MALSFGDGELSASRFLREPPPVGSVGRRPGVGVAGFDAVADPLVISTWRRRMVQAQGSPTTCLPALVCM
jgi:hypothetical protein